MPIVVPDPYPVRPVEEPRTMHPLAAALTILLAVGFTAWRFTFPGRPVSLPGTVEVFAHFYVAIVLWEAGKQTWQWLWFPFTEEGDWPGFWSRFPWLLHACWFVPSMVELVLFLRSPFNPF